MLCSHSFQPLRMKRFIVASYQPVRIWFVMNFRPNLSVLKRVTRTSSSSSLRRTETPRRSRSNIWINASTMKMKSRIKEHNWLKWLILSRWWNRGAPIQQCNFVTNLRYRKMWMRNLKCKIHCLKQKIVNLKNQLNLMRGRKMMLCKTVCQIYKDLKSKALNSYHRKTLRLGS